MKPRPATIVSRFLAGWTIEQLANACRGPDIAGQPAPSAAVLAYVERAIRNALNRKRSKRA